MHSLKRGQWVEFLPSFFTNKKMHGKISGFSEAKNNYVVYSKDKYFEVPEHRIKPVSFEEVMYGD